MEVQGGTHRSRCKRRGVDRIDHTRSKRGETRQYIDSPKGVVRERPAPAFIEVREELRLIGCHIDADRALALAGFTGEAKVERFLDLFVLPLIRQYLALHQLP